MTKIIWIKELTKLNLAWPTGIFYFRIEVRLVFSNRNESLHYMILWHLIVYLCTIFPFCKERESPIRICTFNIRYDNPADGQNQWSNRKQAISDFIHSRQLDIIGMQEALHHQVVYLDSILEKYSFSGTGRDDGFTQGEYSPIFFRTQRFDLLESKQFWLSDTPEKPGSMGWDAACPRIVNAVKLSDKINSRIFWFLNTHFDHVGDTARTNSCTLISNFTSTIKEPILLVGDFNVNESSSVYQDLLNTFTNIRMLAKKTQGPPYTFHGFRGYNSRRNIIDHIFVTKPKSLEVIEHEINTYYRNDIYLSDHFPVIAKIVWHE